MALMFPRLARNFMKNGYFPTDEVTLSRIFNAISPSHRDGLFRVYDPCAGEGVALAECKAHLVNQGKNVLSYGIEYESERAAHAKQLVDRCIKGSLFDCIVSQRSVGLLFLNPPYGDKVSDKAGTGDRTEGKQRLETDFLNHALHTLQLGGVMVLIVPYYVLKGDFAQSVAKYFERVEIFMAPEQQFKQAVIFGVRKRAADNMHQMKNIRDRLTAVGEGALPAELPEHQWDEPYEVPPSTQTEMRFQVGHIDTLQLNEEIQRSPCLWSQFSIQFGSIVTEHRRPLRPLSPWHLALALAAGQVSGVVTSKDGRIFVIKGDTHKVKKVTTQTEIDGENITEVRIATDEFVPTIRAIDFTPGSPQFGSTVVIQ